jgi:gliding motility-associated-like protein
MKLDLIKNIALVLMGFNLFSFEVYSQETEVPDPPVFQSVTIDLATGHTLLTWDLSPTPEVTAYIIFLEQSDAWITVDTVKDPTATFYEYDLSKAVYYPESYVISAYDSSSSPDGRESPLTDRHTTIFTSVAFDSCTGGIDVSWTPYIGWADSLESYFLYAEINGDSVYSPELFSSDNLQFRHENVLAKSDYCYYVEAIRSDGTRSKSNKACVFTEMAKPPAYINADYATVSGEKKISLSFTIDPDSEIKTYKLLHSIDETGSFDAIADFQNVISDKIEYIDQGPDLNQNHYYRLAAINLCNRIVQQSNLAGNIVVNSSNKNTTNSLSWTLYKYWFGGTEEYRIYRITGNGLTELIVTLPGSDSIYSDNIREFLFSVTDREFCYYVEAIEGNSNPYGIKAQSKSNTSCVILNPDVYMPNAFTPNGDNKNDYIRPVLSFTPKDYVFVIRNRWGNKIFETMDPLESWDGKVRNKPAPEGIYIYFLRIIPFDGDIIERNGHITLIYPK